MAENNVTADRIQIEIEANSSQAAENLRSLTAALKEFQAATRGKFGDVTKQIKEISESAGQKWKTETKPQDKVRGRQETLERATEKIKSPPLQNVQPHTKEIKQAVNSVINLYDKLMDHIKQNSGAVTRDAASDALREIHAEQDNLQKILDQIQSGAIQAPKNPTTLNAAIKDLQNLENIFKEFWANPAPININWDSVRRVTEEFRKEAEKIEKSTSDPLAALKEKIKGTSLSGILGDVTSIDEAIARFKEIGNQAGILELKLLGVREKLTAAFERGNLAQIATYTAQMQKLQKQINDLKTAPKDSEPADMLAAFKERIKGTTLAEILGDVSSIDEAIAKMAELKDQTAVLEIKLIGLREKLQAAFESGNLAQIAAYTAQMQKLQEQIKKLKSSDTSKNASDAGQVESEESLNNKLGIISRIADLLSKIGGTEIDVGKDLSGILNSSMSKRIKSIIPKGADTTVKALEGAFSGLTEKVLGFASAHPVVTAALIGLGIAAKVTVGEMKKLAQTAVSLAKAGFNLLADGAKKLASALKNLASAGISKLASGLKSVGKYVISDFTKPFQTAIKAVSQWKSAIGRIIFYRVVRGAIKAVTDGFKTGIENLYQYSRLVGTEFAPAMDKLATSSLYLKNSLGAMAAPLIQALAPVVDMLIDKFVALINVIGKAFAMLTGKSVYTQAKKHAVEYGEAANKASKATKDFLLGIDELNVINDSAGGASSALEDYGSMFEEVEVPADQFDWVKQIREAIENGEWRSVGELVANKLNEVVDSWNSYDWGKRLGELVNNGLNVAYGFLTEFNFEQLGSKIANGLNGIFEGIDTDLLGRTFAAKWNALFDFIYGFATTLEWHKIGLDIAEAINGFLDELNAEKAAQAVSKFVTGLFDTISTAIAETHWDVLGDKLAQFLNGVDWYGAIYGALSIITNGLAALKQAIDSFLKNWKWKDMAKQVYDAINKAWKDVDWPGLGKTLGNLVVTALKFAVEIISKIDWPQIGRDIGKFLISIDWVAVFAGLTNVIAAGINAAVGALGGLIDTIAPNIKKIAAGIAQKVNEFFDKIDWAETGRVLSNGFEAALDFMIEFMQKVDWDSIGKHIAEFMENIDWDTLLTKLGQLLGEIMSAKMKLIDVSGILDVGANIVKGLWNGIWAEFDASGGIIGWVQRNIFDLFLGALKWLFGIHSPSTVMRDEIGVNIVAGLLEGIQGAWGTITAFFENAFGPIISVITGAWDIVKNLTSGNFAEIGTIISDAWSSVQSDSDSKLKKFVSDTGASYKALHTETENKFGEIQRSISKSWGETGADTKQKWSEINSSLNGTWEGLRSNADTRFSGVKQTVTGAWSEIEAKTESSWSSASSTISEKMGEIKSSIERPFTGVDGLIAKASTWGRDLVKNLADGMERNKSLVDNASRMTARGISSYLHFTEPDVGPLSDFHTYMPDMLDLMSKGIKDNTYKAVNAASQLAASVSSVLGNVEPVQPKFASYPTPQFTEGYSNTQVGGRSISNYSSQESSSGSNDFSSAIYAAAGMIVEAIQNQDNSVYLDGKMLMKSVERSQRERGANIMAGGVML